MTIEFQENLKILGDHPRIDKSISLYIFHYLEISKRFKFVTKVLSDESRYLICLKAASHVLSNDQDFTLSSLQDFAVAQGLSSRNRVSTIFKIATMAGYVDRKSIDGDARKKIIIAGRNFDNLASEIFKYYYVPLMEIYPAKYDFLISDKRKAMAQLSALGVELYLNEVKLVDKIAGADIFCRRDGGYEILMCLSKAINFRTPSAHMEISFPFSQLSYQLFLSRSHIQKIFKAAEQEGLLIIKERGGKRIELLPPLSALSRKIIIGMLAMAKVVADQSQPNLHC